MNGLSVGLATGLVGVIYVLLKYLEYRYPAEPTRRDFTTFIGPRLVLVGVVMMAQAIFEVPASGSMLITQAFAIIGMVASIELGFRVLACNIQRMSGE